ncbi:DUF1540 domain-containing protein [Cohnella sp. REN36]|uniref:DUF1540 domain-containing protein n=1 Tax=Cohnella sp. REN36 TaxID=2887347 RepID=UPI001D142074|nr:DUF1540 domain-containing protein [Cohnella sp. REN36]MCC3372824.1 DUF1540 domain-containing protein [Cohnella sp. REN36]
MPSGVACSVSNCAFWGEGNRCAAQEIAIEIDAHARTNLNEEFAEETFESHQDRAANSKGTCCLTFRPKDQATST